MQSNFFSFNQDALIKEIEALENKLHLEAEIKNKNYSDISKDMDDDPSGSDSEPSLDNFDNEQLIKLLPTFVKKKSIL